MAWVVVAGVAILVPALVHGLSLGPFDLLSQFGLSKQPGVVPHNPVASDQIEDVIPFLTLAWTQVHHGHLPLWNPYSGLGLPLAFNWTSAPFGLPALVGYLVPVRFAFTVGVATTVVIAGTGMYVFGRVLGLGILGSAMAATVFELSGPVAGWLGWPVASTMSWAGWLFAATLFLFRTRHRARGVAFLAVVLALAIYSGFPELVVVFGLALVVFLATVLSLWRLRGNGPPIQRPFVDLALALVAGFALSAPLVLPGLQVLHSSFAGNARYADEVFGVSFRQALPLNNLADILTPSFNGLPTAGSHFFGSLNYVWSADYLGVIAVVFAVTALVVRRRQPEVVGLGVVAVVAAAIVFVPPVMSLMNRLPVIGGVYWVRGALPPMAFALAALSGVGLDILVRSHGDRAVRWGLWGGFAAAAVGLLVLWTAGRGHLSRADAAIRDTSFIGPVIETACALAIVGAVLWLHRRAAPRHVRGGWTAVRLGRVAGLCFLTCETVFLVLASAPLWSSSATGSVATPAQTALTKTAGSSLVGIGNFCYSRQVGVLADVNLMLDLRELMILDPMFPRTYESSFQAATGQAVDPTGYPLFCPDIPTVAVAREYGVRFVLEPHGVRGPRGAVFVRDVGGEGLYRIPGAALATLVPLTRGRSLPAPQATGAVLAVTHPGGPASWTVHTDLASLGLLRLRLTDVPGWTATIDGRPLVLQAFAGVMLQARIPPGHHTIALRYWPRAFSDGILLAVLGVVGLVAALAGPAVLARRRRAASAGRGG